MLLPETDAIISNIMGIAFKRPAKDITKEY